ncbi:Hypothetical protein PHPALM_11458 [Phytophthora palmivora]|uniref:Uncharacterized protein n=1 Tax=Phytophthora palmivora TaxID=4796 RepID=A0A2P4Y2I1_9STRA|nr:Hypothetical protein PHPALM_11458 [Phytophthora palmivora]
MKETDEAMVPHTGGEMPLAVYPRLPPYSEQSLQLTYETTTLTPVLQGNDTWCQVEALAQHSAAVQQRTDEQLGQVQRQQERLAEQTSEYLQAQYDRQTALLEQQKEMQRQMDENRQAVPGAESSRTNGGIQGRQLESLTEAVQPHLQARWGAFEQGAAPPTEQRPLVSAAVTVAAGTNLPVPPIYRGSSKKEKREFMDSYAIYTRRIKALNQGNDVKIFVMSLSACIEQGTLNEKDMTETEWGKISCQLEFRRTQHTRHSTVR